MDWLDSVSGILNSPLAQQWLGNNKSPQPAPAPVVNPVVTVQQPVETKKDNTNKILLIGGGFFAVVVTLILVLKK